MTHKIVLIRHGESTWNKENRFTGWTDVDLTDLGREEAREAGRLLKSLGYGFDLAHVSVLKRAIRTLWIALDEMDMMWLPVRHDWRLNERHYGGLQGQLRATLRVLFRSLLILLRCTCLYKVHNSCSTIVLQVYITRGGSVKVF